MGKVIERIVNAERVEDLIAVFGSFDENIRRIEDALGVTIVNRGTELKISGDEEGVRSYGAVCDQLVNWYLFEYATPEDTGEPQFDPFDETQVDLSGIIDYVPPVIEETTEATTAP